MVLVEQSFPRGGKKPKIHQDRKKFDFLAGSDKIGKKRRYKTKVIKYDDEKDADHLSDASSEVGGEIKSVSAENLKYKTVQQGMTIMGRVTDIFDTQVKFSLPGCMTGYVMASHISAPYTKLLQSYVDDEIEDIKKLSDIVTIGEYININILSLTKKGEKVIISGSMAPKDVNKGYKANNIRNGNLLRGAIESIEDHGYVIDLGIPDSRTFLPMKNKDDSLNLEIGQVIWCAVKKCQKAATNSIVIVSNKLEDIKTTCVNGDKIQYYTVEDLKPGMSVDFFINKPLKDGAEGLILINCLGYVHFSQIEDKLRTGKTVKAYLLYTMPITKIPFFTTRNIFKTLSPKLGDELKHNIGDIIEDAKVTKFTSSSIIFKTDKNFAIMPKSLIDSTSDDDIIKEFYKPGSIHKIRIMDYFASDYACLCTNKMEILNRLYFTLNDLHIGEVVEATVDVLSDNGIAVKIDNLRGWIPDVHTSDAGINNSAKSDPKHINIMIQKFKPGQKISVRVLRVEPMKNLLHLTAKPSLLSSNIKVLARYEDAKIGYQYKGVIVQCLPHGILVTFFGGVRAIVNINNLSNEKITDINSVFHIGQIVNCTVLSVNSEAMRMICSLKHPGKTEESDEEEKTDIKESKKKRKLPKSDTSNEVESNSELPEKKKKKKKNTADPTVENIVNINKAELSKENKKSKSNTETQIIAPICVAMEVDKSKKKKKNKLKKEEATIKIAEIDESTKQTKKKKKQTSSENNLQDIVTKASKIKKPSEESITSQFSSMSNFWELGASTIAKNIVQISQETSSDDSDEELNKEQTKKKKKRLSVAEKVEKARQEEEKLRNIEEELASAESQPKSSDQFDRLLLANPSNSELWIAYMAFHLQATEIDRARSVARKALNSISFREEHEKLNVWLALLNLENRFGTKESLKVVTQEALQANDSYQIHSKLLDMFVETGKIIELTALVDTLLAKYKGNPDMYSVVGQACYKSNLVDKARAVMQKAISRLEIKQHVPVLIKFADMERNNGDSERAETIFEQIVSCQPKRVDVWCVYTDMLIKSGMIDNARLVLERAVGQKLQPRKMKILFKKWMELEERYGSPEKVETVRQMAINYVEKAT